MHRYIKIKCEGCKIRGETEVAILSPHSLIYTSLQCSLMVERQIVINSTGYTARGKIRYPLDKKYGI